MPTQRVNPRTDVSTIGDFTSAHMYDALLLAWSYTIQGLPEPLVLPAVTVTSQEQVNPDHPGSALSELLGRGGTALRVDPFRPYCGGTPRKTHLIEDGRRHRGLSQRHAERWRVRSPGPLAGDLHPARPGRGGPGRRRTRRAGVAASVIRKRWEAADGDRGTLSQPHAPS